MMKRQMKRLVSLVLLCALCAGLLTVEASAALRTDRVTMTEGDTRTLYAVEAERSLGWISTNPAVVEVLTQGGNRCEIRAKSGGTAIVYCRYYKTEYVGNIRQMIQRGIDYQITVNASRKITVTFEPVGGRLSGAGEKEVSGTYGPLPTAARNGWTFLGWYTQPEGGTRITSSSRVTATKDHTLYAHWQAIPTVPSAAEKPATTEEPVPTERPATTEEPVPTETPAATDPPAAGFAGTRTRARNFHQITLNTMGGWTLYERWYTNRYGRLNYLPKPIRNGYTFLGWYTAPQGGEMVTTATTFSREAILYARWA